MKKTRLSTETIQSATLALESVDNIKGGDGLSLGVFSVGDGITNDTFEESLENTTGLFVDHCLDASDGHPSIATIVMKETYWLRYA